MHDVLPLPVAANVSLTSTLSFSMVPPSSNISTASVVLPSSITARESATPFTVEYPTCSHFSDNPVLTPSAANEPPTRVTIGMSPEPSKIEGAHDVPLTWRDYPLLAFGLFMSTFAAIFAVPGMLLRLVVSVLLNVVQLGADDVVVAILIGRLTASTKRFLRDAAEFDRWNGRRNNGTAKVNTDKQSQDAETFSKHAATQTDNLPWSFQGCNEACRVRHDHLRAEATQWVSEQSAKITALSRENSKLKAAAINYEDDVLDLNTEYDELSGARTKLFNAEKAQRAEKDAFKLQLEYTSKALKRAEAKVSGYETQIEKWKKLRKQLNEQLDARKQECEELWEINEIQEKVLLKYDKILRKDGSTARTLEGIETHLDGSAIPIDKFWISVMKLVRLTRVIRSRLMEDNAEYLLRAKCLASLETVKRYSLNTTTRPRAPTTSVIDASRVDVAVPEVTGEIIVASMESKDDKRLADDEDDSTSLMWSPDQISSDLTDFHEQHPQPLPINSHTIVAKTTIAHTNVNSDDVDISTS